MEPSLEPRSGLEGQILLERSQRLLEMLRKVFNHDLPNQLVAIEGLIRLLDLEEREHLGPDGKDFLSRLARVASRVQNMARHLRELARLGAPQDPPEHVDLAELLREVRAALNQLCPEIRIEYHVALAAPAVRAGRRNLLQALVELLGDALSAPSRPHLTLNLGSASVAEGIEFWADLDASPRPPPEPLTLALVEELLATCGGILQTNSRNQNLFCLLLPRP